jgi:hypothetical protein
VEAADILATIAQLSVTLAGFTGIVVILGDPGARMQSIQIFRVAILLSLTLGAMTLALLPFVFFLMGVQEFVVWRIASILLGLFSVLFLLAFQGRTRRFMREYPEIFNPAILTALLLGHLANSAAQAANASGAFGGPQPGLPVLGLLWLLLHGAYQFVRILFIPLRSS